LTWKHPLDNSEITGYPEVIPGQKSAWGSVMLLTVVSCPDLLEARFWTSSGLP
jgi:hypothetical protein